MKPVLKGLARAAATLAVVPALLSFWIRAAIFGRDRALEGSTQALAWVPGIAGQYLRTAFLRRVLAHCHYSATIGFGTVFSKIDARLDENVYVGPACHLGLVHIERDALIGAGVHVPSGPSTHGIDHIDVPIRDQPGKPQLVRIREGAWIGSGAIVMADVGRGSVVAAGAVVTTALPDQIVAAGVPARVVKSRT